MTENRAIRRVIVNADDLGLTEGVNRGIVAAFQHGIVTSTTLIAGGRAFEHAVALIQQEALDTGIHLTLLEEAPVLPPRLIPSLAREGGRLPRRYPFLLQGLVRRRIRLDEVRAELRAQIERCQAKGVVLSHMDSHQHVHLWPPLLTLCIELAREYGIPAMRCPRVDWRLEYCSRQGRGSALRLAMVLSLHVLAKVAAPRITQAGLKITDHFAGLLISGGVNERRLTLLLERLHTGVTELVVHPGEEDVTTRTAYPHWGYHWPTELQALTRLRDTLPVLTGSLELISYRQFVGMLSATPPQSTWH